VTERLADVFNRFADFPSRFAEAFLHLTARIIRAALSGEIVVVDSFADSFFSFAFSLIPFSFNFIPIR
jgi:hypothetical protein